MLLMQWQSLIRMITFVRIEKVLGNAHESSKTVLHAVMLRLPGYHMHFHAL